VVSVAPPQEIWQRFALGTFAWKPGIMLTIGEYEQLFDAHGGTDATYLRHHFLRYTRTKQRLLSNWDRSRGNRVLDVGAHWLHQALMYARDGFSVTAIDMPVTLETDCVRRLAKAYAIELLPNRDLEHPEALAGQADNSFDLVLFTEIIEHITFNPVAMWREIYRVMKPGARIVITTPNYYALRSRTWRWGRFLNRFGGGIDIPDILSHRTYVHHWKEYSLRELVFYFRLLSPDFTCANSAHVEEYNPNFAGNPLSTIAGWLEHVIAGLRPDVYIEIELARKDKGIVVEPHW